MPAPARQSWRKRGANGRPASRNSHYRNNSNRCSGLEARLHKVRKELREILSMLAAPTPQLQVKEQRPVAAPAAKPGLFEL